MKFPFAENPSYQRCPLLILEEVRIQVSILKQVIVPGFNPGVGQNTGFNPEVSQNTGSNPEAGQNIGFNPVVGQNTGFNPEVGHNIGFFCCSNRQEFSLFYFCLLGLLNFFFITLFKAKSDIFLLFHPDLASATDGALDTYNSSKNSLVLFSSVQFLDRLCFWGDVRNNSAEILYQSFLQKALGSSSGMGRDVHSLMLSI